MRVRFKSIIFQLLITYNVLAIIIVITLGGYSYISFSSVYEKEIEKLDNRLLDQIKNSLELKIFDQVDKLYFDLSTNKQKYPSLFKINSSENFSAKDTLNSYEYLKNMVAMYSDILYAITIYSQDDEFLISSTAGYKNLNSKNGQLYFKLNWLNDKVIISPHGTWLPADYLPSVVESNDSNKHLITYARFFPFINNNEKHIIAFHIRDDAIINIIKELVPDDFSSIILLDEQWNIADIMNSDMIGHPFITYLHKNSPSDQHGTFKASLDNIPTVLTYTSINRQSWKLVKIEPLKAFYKNSILIKKKLLTFIGLTILIGLLLASIFSFILYTPLKPTLNAIYTYFNNRKQKLGNEYTYINTAIYKMTEEIDDLKNTLKTNEPLIKHHLVIGLLNNTLLSLKEVKDKLNILELSMKHKYYNVLLLDFDVDIINKLLQKDRQYIRYNTIDQLNNHTNITYTFLATEISSNQVGIIINSSSDNINLFQRFILDLIKSINNKYGIPVTAYLGKWKSNPLLLHQSFDEAKIVEKYKYFITDYNILTADIFIKRELSINELPEEIITKMLSSLNALDIEELEKILKKLIYEIKENCYSANHCHQFLLKILHIVSNDTRTINYKRTKQNKSSIYDDFKKIKNITQFEVWLINYLKNIFPQLIDMKNNTSYRNIKTTKDFIHENIDKDLSLDFIADKIGLTPNYLSKLFKNIEGINFIDYVTQKRLKTAGKMLLKTDLTISEICHKVGYNNPSYFNTRFKKHFGCTPTKYRITNKTTKK